MILRHGRCVSVRVRYLSSFCFLYILYGIGRDLIWSSALLRTFRIIDAFDHFDRPAKRTEISFPRAKQNPSRDTSRAI